VKIEGTHTINAPREVIWKLIVDPTVIARCIPGVEKMEPTGEDTYSAVLNVGVASIRGKYTGKVRLHELQPSSSYKLDIDGRGTQGFVKGTGEINLEEKDGQTTVRYSGEVQIGGAIAGIGQRMLQGTTRMMTSQFFTAIEAEADAVKKAVEERAAVIPPKHGMLRTLLRSLLSLFKRLLIPSGR
jgi:hypothetical protein